MPSLARLDLEEYVTDVLPHSYALWGDGRTFERYVADLRSLAASPYGTRRFTLTGLREGGEIVASLKRYTRDLRIADRALRTSAIGAVFVPPARRGDGLAHDLLRRALNEERARGADVALLFSDIGAAFYEALGFELLPARTITLRTTSLPDLPLDPQPFEGRDWQAIAPCFDAADAHDFPRLRRSALVWNWLAVRESERTGEVKRLRLLRGDDCIAYVVGRNHGAGGAFILDECGADPQHGNAVLGALIRHAAGSDGNVHGWLPPPAIRMLLPQGSVKRRAQGLPMIAPLSLAAKRLWNAHRDAVNSADGDLFWWFDHV